MIPPPARYSSTRYQDHSQQEFFSFEEVVLKGLATDGGLFHPEVIPSISEPTLRSWRDLSFPDLAFQIIRLYIDISEISDPELHSIVKQSYSTFRHPDTVPLVTLDKSKNLHLLELFHGPTLAFKDVALQFLGNLFEFFLTRKNRSLNGSSSGSRHHLTVIGATSGDTGSAAIYGLRGKKDVSIFIMYPDGKVSPIQEAQMTAVPDPNVHCVAVEGTFDDCQDTVKALFADPELNKTHHLAAVNSINWARILAQITYYFYAYFALQKSHSDLLPVKFVVPTGNFGDILAGYFAKRMGLPIAKLVIATNENDILHRFWQTGSYTKESAPPSTQQQQQNGFTEDGVKAHTSGVKETLSPAMDILVSSNFERLLWYLQLEQELSTHHDHHPSSPQADLSTSTRAAGAQIASYFTSLRTTGSFAVPPSLLASARKDFSSHRVSDAETAATIHDAYRGHGVDCAGYILDPHSAIGVAAALREIANADDAPGSLGSGSGSEQKQGQRREQQQHTVALATAHPAKFAKAVEVTLKGEEGFDFQRDVLPKEFEGLLDRAEKRRTRVGGGGVEGVVKEVKRMIVERVGSGERN